MPLEIRPFRPDEAGALRDIRLEALAAHPPAFAERHDVALAMGGEDFAAALAEGAVFGVFDDSACLGMAGLDRWRGTNVQHKATVWGVYLSPAARGRGAGEALFQAMIDHARAIGIEALELGVGDFNDHAQALYRRMGFVPYGLEPRAVKLHDRYIDEVLMALIL
jgi:ribosomal protein S18 acetylase RimI-like enzyme